MYPIQFGEPLDRQKHCFFWVILRGCLVFCISVSKVFIVCNPCKLFICVFAVVSRKIKYKIQNHGEGISHDLHRAGKLCVRFLEIDTVVLLYVILAYDNRTL